MLQFEPFSDSLLVKVLPYIRKNRSLCSEFSAGYLYMWNKDTDVRFCLWNFTSVGFAEVGCRLFPADHGKGYGSRAFGLTADYAESALNVRVTARCFRENIASRRMIEANGFVPVRRDDTHIYFERRTAASHQNKEKLK